MPDNPQIHRVHDLAYAIAEQNAFMREVVAKAQETLGSPPPNTFLGRKTQEPFPKEPPEHLPTTNIS